MAIRVAINGFGRIGRGYLRAQLNNPNVVVVAVNDLTSPETNAHLLKYDSTQGRLGLPVTISAEGMTVGDHVIKVLAERDPANLPWGELDIDVVIESTGRFTSRDAAAVNIVPSSTGAARATSLVLEAMKGRLDGTSLRVPIPVGSITDFTAIVRSTTVDEVNAAFKAAADGGLKGVLVYTDEPIVSEDIVGTPASCTFDSKMTLVQRINDEQSLVKIFGWYDNEWGYSNRLVDLTTVVGA